MVAHTTATTDRSMAEYAVSIDNTINAIGSKREPKLPSPNDDAAALAQDCALSKIIFDAAERRKDASRAAFMAAISIPPVKGKHIVHDSTFAVAEVQNVAAARRLHEPTLLNLLAKAGMSVDVAAAIIEAAKVGSDAFTSRLTVLLKK